MYIQKGHRKSVEIDFARSLRNVRDVEEPVEDHDVPLVLGQRLAPVPVNVLGRQRRRFERAELGWRGRGGVVGAGAVGRNAELGKFPLAQMLDPSGAAARALELLNEGQVIEDLLLEVRYPGGLGHRLDDVHRAQALV